MESVVEGRHLLMDLTMICECGKKQCSYSVMNFGLRYDEYFL